MGAAQTRTHIHRDNGGLSITIAPIVGRKEIILVHRDDGRLLYDTTTTPGDADYQSHPLTAFANAWRVVLSPGDILVMPAGTYHSARNLEPCLSYSRFHLDRHDLVPALVSWRNGDAEESVMHEEIFWNACYELVLIVEAQSRTPHCQVQEGDSNQTRLLLRDAWPYLQLMRHLVRAIVLQVLRG